MGFRTLGKELREGVVIKWNEGYPVSHIAAFFGVTEPTVYRWLKAAGVYTPRKQQKQEVTDAN